MIRLGLTLLCVYLLYCVALFALQRRMLFPRAGDPGPPPPPPKGALPLQLKHAQGVAEGLLLLGEGVSAARPGGLVLFGHGNGELIQEAAPALRPYLRLGLSVALLEYRGYGRSDGAPSEAALIADAIAFHDQIIRRPEVDPQRVILHGHSLGGGVMSGLAAARPPKALILSSTFASVRRMARRHLAPGALVRDPFDSAARLRGIKAPILISHGRQDTLIPFEHGLALAAAAPSARFIALDCAHNDCPTPWAEIEALLSSADLLDRRR